MYSRATALLVVIMLSVTATASAVDITASVDKSVVSLGDSLILTVTISGVRSTHEPKLPESDDFSVSYSGSSTQIQIINDKTTIGTSYQYSLKPLKTGKLTIGPITLDYLDKTFKSKPIAVEVKGEAAKPVSRKGIFIEISTDKSEVYLHEQVILSFRFYHSGVRLGAQPSYEPPSASGFVERQLGDGTSKNFSQVLNGRLYRVSELKTAMFPYQSGELSIGPAKLKGVILVESGRRPQRRVDGFFDFDDFFSDPFFGRFTQKPFELVSNKVNINVRELPKEGAPEGEVSVGSYKLQVEAKPREVSVGDPITLTMRVIGEGDFETVAPPKLVDVKGFKSYEATSSTKITERVSGVKGVKTFEQAIVPLDEGIDKVPQIAFNYFDPQKGRYLTLKRGPIPIKVLPAKEEAAKIVSLPVGIGKKGIKLLERNIVFIKTSPGNLFRGSVSFAPSYLFWMVQCIPLLLLLLAIVHNRRRIRLRSDFGYARLYNADRKMKQRLGTVQVALKKGSVEDFYGALVKAVNMYVADRLNIPSGGLTPEIIRENLESKGVAAEFLRRLDAFYQASDIARFASTETDRAEMESAYREARAILSALRSSRF